MTQKVYFAVTGRIPGDDEDSLYTFHCATRDEAVAAFEEAIFEDGMEDKDAIYNEHGCTVFINSVVASRTPIVTIDDPSTPFVASEDPPAVARPRVLVVVSGGIADPIYDEGVDVEVFDWDNYNDSPEKTGGVPEHFADLAKSCGIPVQTEDGNPN